MKRDSFGDPNFGWFRHAEVVMHEDGTSYDHGSNRVALWGTISEREKAPRLGVCARASVAWEWKVYWMPATRGESVHVGNGEAKSYPDAKVEAAAALIAALAAGVPKALRPRSTRA